MLYYEDTRYGPRLVCQVWRQAVDIISVVRRDQSALPTHVSNSTLEPLPAGLYHLEKYVVL